jgi:dTDP-4-amino-4,6-dideoxygalactose transaminase
MREIPFNKPFLAGTELDRLREALADGLASGGRFTARCEQWLAALAGSQRALLSHSATGALEAAAMLAGLGPGDEAIVPSFAYPTTASAIVRQGATPVFVDVDPATLNIDPSAVAAAIGDRTKAVVALHYGGVACDLDALLAICQSNGLLLIEDAAQCLLASYKGRALGGIGALGTLSFHHTKNVTCGEGGCLLVGEESLMERAETIWEKGTDRGRFARGEVDRYSWVAVGSSFGASELTAALLYAQLEVAAAVTARRRAIWQSYHEGFAELESDGRVRRPVVPDGCEHNAHIYYLLLAGERERDAFIDRLAGSRIQASFHYTPLHSSPAGLAYGRSAGGLGNTERASRTLVRLPLFADLDEESVERVIDAVRAAAGVSVEPIA